MNGKPLEITGASPATLGRLEAVVEMVVGPRMAEIDAQSNAASATPLVWKFGPAFEVHIMSGLRALMADRDCRLALRRIVEHGEETHVTVVLHGDAEENAEALMPDGFLVARLMAGRGDLVTVPW